MSDLGREDTDGGHTEDVLTRTRVHLFRSVSVFAIESWIQSTRSLHVAVSEFYSEVEGAPILFGVKSTMMIEFGIENSSAKNVMRRHVLMIQECVRNLVRFARRNGRGSTTPQTVRPER